MTWTIYHCEDPDFWVRSVPDDIQFGVERASLARSEVFRDMFSCCSATDDNNGSLDLEESSEMLTALLRLLHSPPPFPSRIPHSGEQDTTQIRVREYEPTTVIPLPMLPVLFTLGDKYLLADSVIDSLNAHLLANASSHPLQVYGLATQYGLDSIASAASKYLLHPPLWSYTADDVKANLSTEAYHRLVQLHAFRIKRLCEVLLAEEVFPHGYGECPSHSQKTSSLWERAKTSLAWKIESGTDVAAEMASLLDSVHSCQMCRKACTAATEMLAYKCRRIPRQLDQLPSNT